VRPGLALAAMLAAASAQADPIEVTVSGAARSGPPVSARDATAASTVIRKKELRAPGGSSADLLGRVPGVVTTRTGAASDLATASIRGASSAEVPVYLAGIRLNDDVTGTADLSTVPLWMLGRVEIFRGNAPAQADRQGLGGAVYFEPDLPSGSRLRAGASLGSFGSRAGWAGASVGSPRSSALVAVRRETADNDYSYLDDGGTRFDPRDDRVRRRVNADTSSWDAWSISRHALGRSARILTLLNAFDREQGVTGLSVVPAHHARSHVRRVLGAVSAVTPCLENRAGEEERCALELATTWILAETTLSDPARELAAGASEVTSRGQRVAETARVTGRLTDWLKVGLGVDPSSERLVLARPENLREARRSSARSAATLNVTPAQGWEFLGLLFGEFHQTTAAGDDRTIAHPGGRVGARVALGSGLGLLANAGHYVRAPTLGELYGVSPLVLGSPDLRPETGDTMDLGLRWALGDPSAREQLWLDAFAFARDARDLISYRQSSLGVMRPFNVGRARTLGSEIALGGRWLGLFRGDASVTLMDARDRTRGRSITNDLLPLLPRLVLSGHVAAERAFSRDVRAEIGARVRHVASRYADPAGLIVIPEQTTWDLEALGAFWDEVLAARAVLRNLADTRTFDVVGLPQPGRSLWASVEVIW
jgi:vitamin B12 transporter